MSSVADPPTTLPVLVVDDDDEIRITLRDLLEGEGYPVLEAPDGLAALSVLQNLRSSAVVITNHQMPRLDGPGLLQFVAEDPSLRSRTACIYITASTRVIPPVYARLLDDLAVPVIRKPFDVDTLLDAVTEAAQRLKRR